MALPKGTSGGGSGGGSLIQKAAKKINNTAKGARAVTRRVSTNRSSSGSSSRRSSGGGSSYSSRPTRSRSNTGGGSGGGGSSSKAPMKAPPTPKAVIPSIGSYLGTDDVYQNAVRGSKRTMADFVSELGRRRGEATNSFNQTKSSMERDRVQQLEALRDEFASRGLIQSGIYGEEQGKFQKQYDEQLRTLGSQQTSLLADLMSQQTNYGRENQMAMEAAKQEALARRAARYKVGA